MAYTIRRGEVACDRTGQQPAVRVSYGFGYRGHGAVNKQRQRLRELLVDDSVLIRQEECRGVQRRFPWAVHSDLKYFFLYDTMREIENEAKEVGR